MRSSAGMVLVAALFLGAPGCQPSRHSGSGFRLPSGADAERGKSAFLALGCGSCHDVAGVALPRPGARSGSVILLGGPVPAVPTDGRLVTAITYPGSQRALHMPDYSDRMTVQQLNDIIAFLQPAYSTIPPPHPYPYHSNLPEH